ncbi:hypothetical protein I7I53_05094 [Histoplasma capsulatum var. duboisii H88]|uniref:Uncharacterized protein n=1 Tax=Ajellomyces capsulatus (strain H88) TaxID=544711 RepID=A0A8A1LXZ0_AJEC8|nr:hypothetical protein I7I53_05094 [Histoplasma capsulatum var. duboisii H88]
MVRRIGERIRARTSPQQFSQRRGDCDSWWEYIFAIIYFLETESRNRHMLLDGGQNDGHITAAVQRHQNRP